MGKTWRYVYEREPPSHQDIDILRKELAILEAGELRDLLANNPPQIIFDHPLIATNPRVNAAFFPGQNTVSFKVGRVFPESVQHEFFHAGQERYLGPSFCVLPDEIILGDNAPIGTLGVGSLAIGSKAVPRRVKKVFTRAYKGLLITIKALGSLPLIVTQDHPILTANITFDHYWPRTQYIPKELWRYTHKIRHRITNFAWKRAMDITEGDFLVRPKMQEHYLDSWSGTISGDLAELMGLYCAEGSIIYYRKTEASGVVLSFGSHETVLITRAQELLRKLCNNEPYLVHWDNSTRVCITSARLALFLRENVGFASNNKHIPDSLMYGDKEILRRFLQGYLRGDGHPNKDRKSSKFTTVSKLLALQIQLAMTRFSANVSLWENNIGDVGYIMGRRVKIAINYVGDILDKDRDYSRSVPRIIPSDNENIYPYVKSVSASWYSGQVANIAIQGDPTFLVSNLVTHNCSTHDCEEAAYQFERMHPKILLRMETRILSRREP